MTCLMLNVEGINEAPERVEPEDEPSQAPASEPITTMIPSPPTVKRSNRVIKGKISKYDEYVTNIDST